MSKINQIGGSRVQDYRFYNAGQDTVKDCPVGDLRSHAEQVKAKQSLVNGYYPHNGSETTQTGGSEATQTGGNPAPLPYRWFNPQCGCADCPSRCPQRYGADLHQDRLAKASASGFLDNCGCQRCLQIGAGMGFSTALDEQTGGGPVGAPLYISSPSRDGQVFPNKQNTKPGGFKPLKYNFTLTDGVQFVPLK